jgi:hypothetical protein
MLGRRMDHPCVGLFSCAPVIFDLADYAEILSSPIYSGCFGFINRMGGDDKQKE